MLRGALPAELMPSLDAVLRERLGHRIPERRMQQIAESVSMLASESGYLDLAEYLALVRTLPVDAPLVQSLVRTVTNKESYFFRDTATMASLREHILPPLLERCSGSRVLRVWSAGCSTGEEIYSLSILLQDLLVDYEKWTISLVGTDIDESAVTRARRADYKEWSLRATPLALRSRYFHFDPLARTYSLNRIFRQNVSFGLHNLADPQVAPPSPSTFDLILCRNVLIYFGAEGQADVRRKFRAALSPGGIWLGGPSDPSPGNEWQTVVYPGALVHTPATGARVTVPASPAPPAPPLARPSAAPRPPVRPVWVDRPTPRPERPAPVAVAPPVDLPPLHLPSKKPPAAAVDSDVAFRRALELANRGELTQARAVLSELVQNDPLSAEAYLLLSTVEHSLGAVDTAVRELRRAIYLDPSHAEAHLRLGLLLSEAGQRDAAIRSLRTTVVLLSALEAPTPDDHQLRQTAATQMVRLLREDA